MTEVEPTKRLHAAERSDLRLAITCRTLIAGFALLWYVGAGLVTVFEPRLTGVVALAAYTGIGIAHLCVIGTSLDRWWLKYTVYAADILGICAFFVLIPVSRAAEVPQIIAFRAYGIYYLFPVIAMAALTLSWRLCLWSGRRRHRLVGCVPHRGAGCTKSSFLGRHSRRSDPSGLRSRFSIHRFHRHRQSH